MRDAGGERLAAVARCRYVTYLLCYEELERRYNVSSLVKRFANGP